MGQVGQTSLAVVPTMKGFRRKLNDESKSAARAAGKSMTSEYGKTGVAAGRAMGQNFRKGSSDASRALKEITRENAQATSAWSTANRAHADQIGRVRVAQAKLNDATSKYGSESTQAVTAQERLAAAQRRSEETGLRLETAQTRLTAAAKSLKAANDQIGTSNSVWAKMRKDLEPVTVRVSALRDRLRETFAQSKMGKGLGAAFESVKLGIAKATVASFGFGETLVKKVGGAASSVGKTVSGAFNGFLAQSPALNVAFTKMGDGVRAIGRGFQTAGSMLGGVGKAAGTAGSAIARAFGPALAGTWSGIKSQISGAATAMTSMLGGAAVATGAVIAGAMTKAFVGGFSRLSGIENAQAKMVGLGFSSKDVSAAMKGASDAVDGTAFSLDEMASVASVAMAAGLKPGAELNKYMKTLKNASAAANVPLGEMGQILNKTITSGRAYTMEINQIADRGLPIWSKLAEAYGVSADEMREMVSRGEVDTATFLQVVEDMSGGVADAMGGTTSSAIRNFGTALSKLGADMLQGIYPVVGPLFNAMKSGVQMLQVLGAPAFAAMGESMAPLAEKLQAFTDKWTVAKQAIEDGAPPIATIVGVFSDMGIKLEGPLKAIGAIKDTFESLGSAIAPIIGGLLGALGPLLARLPLIGGAFTGLTGPVGLFIGLLVAVWQQSEAFREAVGAVFEGLFAALMPVFEALGPVLGTLGEVFNTVAQVIGDVLATALTAIIPLFKPLGTVLATMVTALGPIIALLGPIAEILGQTLVTAITALSPLLGFIGELLTMLAPIIGLVVGVIAQLLGALVPLLEPIGMLIGALLPPLISLFTTVLTPIMQLAGVIINALMPVIQGLLKMLSGLIEFVVGVFSGDWQRAWNGIKGFFSGFADAIGGIVNGIGDIFAGLIDTIMGIFSGIGGWLVESGRALINGFIEGIMAGFDWAGEKISGALDWIGGFFPNSPAKRGPLSGDGWRRLGRSGTAYADQWVGGAEEGFRAFSMPDLVDDATATLKGIGSSAVSRPIPTSTKNVEINNKIDMFDRDPRIVAKQIGRGVEGALLV